MAEKNLQAQDINNVNLSTGGASEIWNQNRNYDCIAISVATDTIPTGRDSASAQRDTHAGAQ